ncbi:MAG: FAD-binding domain-containing protein [Pseudomonadota bacterium]
MGRAYAAQRNYDRGPGRHTGVSGLSPYLRRRLVTDEEAVAAALGAHGAVAAEKFIQEVFWRSYFKGWLERRPSVWRAYVDGLAEDRARLEREPGLAAEIAAAEAGRTGLEPFDAWAHELNETGYLHNHARMWFASIWIFTLNLPWRLGADFFMRRLLDGDPASNTLGWRWVAGLHTRGKAYAARAANIAKYTEGRFVVGPERIGEAVPLEEEEEEAPPPAQAPRAPAAPDPSAPSVLLITEEDCRFEESLSAAGFAPERFRAAAILPATALRSETPGAEAVAVFERGALSDQAARLSALGAPDPVELSAAAPEAIASWAREAGAAQIVTGFTTIGPLKDRLDAAAPALATAGLRFAELQRRWDALIWPHASAGFFKVKQKIPRLLSELLLDE